MNCYDPTLPMTGEIYDGRIFTDMALHAPDIDRIQNAGRIAMSLNETSRERLRDLIRARLPVQADGSISLIARAWAVRPTITK